MGYNAGEVAGGPSSASLPAGWYEYVDQPSGNSYYHHVDSNTTQWERPLVPKGGQDEKTYANNNDSLSTAPRTAEPHLNILGATTVTQQRKSSISSARPMKHESPSRRNSRRASDVNKGQQSRPNVWRQ